MSEENTPLISKTAFSCPHCGAYTTQNWFQLSADPYSEKHRTPTIPNEAMAEHFRTAKDMPEETRSELVKWVKDMLAGRLFFEKTKNTLYNSPTVHNCNISRCYNCKDFTVWVHDQIVYPNTKIDIKPNGDLPDHKRTYEGVKW